ncbi:L,D-transpeptidase [Aquicella lusitana]|uniref:L,D-transpeptidase-like protein n=1 Tax=Aquicella lusitana TaxID=254246 RepID=A0A370FZX1_9COXI|nr:L,D-transpeptidase [Aquicella lusitana]RDI37207.1 L,D-transpeptidase-like protein [Aquicella lusitana]VVC74281.1 hypothetical protein AQULUS_20460 [Aquicella lusitana]
MRMKRILAILIITALALPSFSAYSKSPRQWCKSTGFECLRIKRGESWQTLFPDERERDIVMRINRTNVRLYPGMVIAVPEDLAYSDLLDYAPFPRFIDPPDEKLIVVDPAKFAWGAYDNDGTLIHWGPATGGASWCDDIQDSCRTKSGRFRVYSLGSSSCVSSKFPIPEGGAPMPYCMFFNGGQALHGSPGGVIPGNVSHGCVRLFVQDAEWLRYDFVEPPVASNDYRGTKVIVLPYSTS